VNGDSQVYVSGTNGGWKDSCDALYFNNSNSNIYIYPAISTSELGSNSYSSLADHDYRYALRHLFLKTKSFSDSGASYTADSYNFFEGEQIGLINYKIQKCSEGESHTPEEWCAYYPTISNIKLLNNLSINVDPDSQGKFNVIRPGFYYVTFNTNVNEEQVPISKLTVRVYKEGDDWTSDTGLKELDNLDAKPIATNPHKIGIFLSSGTYQIMAKVVDNWSTYGCASSPSKDFSSVACKKCCNNSEQGAPLPAFKDQNKNDKNYCEQCF